jgi:hypothetical protein
MAEVTSLELQKKVREFLAPEPHRLARDEVRESAVEVLTRTVQRGWRTYLVGGFLRDVALHPHSRWPRDFDVVVQGCSWDELENAFVDVIAGHNRFGGLLLRRQVKTSNERYSAAGHKLDFDIWRLEDTWAVRHFQLPQTIQAFVGTPFLNIDSVAMSIGPGDDYLTVFENGFFDALKRKSVEVNQTDNPYPILCAVRGLIMAATLNFVVGPKLASFVYELAATVSIEEFITAQIEHYHHVRFSREQLAQLILDVRTQLEAGHQFVHLTSDRVSDPQTIHSRESGNDDT